jgi:hypothetical protein
MTTREDRLDRRPRNQSVGRSFVPGTIGGKWQVLPNRVSTGWTIALTTASAQTIATTRSEHVARQITGAHNARIGFSPTWQAPPGPEYNKNTAP